MMRVWTACLLTSTLSLVACGPPPMKVEIPFQAQAGAAPLRCAAPIDALGSTATTYELKDLRLYVHDVRLVSEDGETQTPVALDENPFQGDGVALLDFEDGQGACQNGNAELHTVITGTVPEGTYHGLRFTVGVPEDKNHQDASTAKAPLNFTSMFWSWKGGYKFIRLDGKTTGQPGGINFHLGSNACDGDPVVCAKPNRFDVSFTHFHVGEHAVIADVQKLFESADLDGNAADSPPGCMGSPEEDADCAAYFDKLGLGPNGGAQVFFRFEAK